MRSTAARRARRHACQTQGPATAGAMLSTADVVDARCWTWTWIGAWAPLSVLFVRLSVCLLLLCLFICWFPIWLVRLCVCACFVCCPTICAFSAAFFPGNPTRSTKNGLTLKFQDQPVVSNLSAFQNNRKTNMPPSPVKRRDFARHLVLLRSNMHFSSSTKATSTVF